MGGPAWGIASPSGSWTCGAGSAVPGRGCSASRDARRAGTRAGSRSSRTGATHSSAPASAAAGPGSAARRRPAPRTRRQRRWTWRPRSLRKRWTTVTAPATDASLHTAHAQARRRRAIPLQGAMAAVRSRGSSRRGPPSRRSRCVPTICMISARRSTRNSWSPGSACIRKSLVVRAAHASTSLGGTSTSSERAAVAGPSWR